MGTRRSSLFALLLLALLVMQSMQLGLFEVRRHAVRKEMRQRIRQGLPAHELVRFSFGAADYARLEMEDGGREFWVDGHLYDVVRSITAADGTVRIEAVDDRDEARLMAGLKDLIEQGMGQRGLDRGKAQLLVSLLAAGMPEDALHCPAVPPAVRIVLMPLCTWPLEGVVDGLLRPPRL